MPERLLSNPGRPEFAVTLPDPLPEFGTIFRPLKQPALDRFVLARLEREDLAPSAVAILLDEFYAVIGDAIGHAGGQIQNLAGDAVMAVFGIPQTHDDDALRAVRAALRSRVG